MRVDASHVAPLSQTTKENIQSVRPREVSPAGRLEERTRLASPERIDVVEQGFQRAGNDYKLQAFGPVVLDLMKQAADLAESTDYGVTA